MNIEHLYDTQLAVDAAIEAKMPPEWEGLDSWQSVEHRKFAFHVEVMELANEIGFFKDWKHSHVVNKEAALEELGDCMAFLLSVGLTLGYSKVVKEIEPFALYEDYPYEDLFDMLKDVHLSNAGKYTLAFSLILGIGLKLGATESEIVEAYLLKAEKNVERQKENY